MGFDDLAKHMASRDGKKVKVASADQLVADIAAADRRIDRQRDLILGPLLLVGGAVILLLYILYIVSATDTTPHPNRPDSPYIVYSYSLPVIAGGAIITGARKLYRGLRGR